VVVGNVESFSKVSTTKLFSIEVLVHRGAGGGGGGREEAWSRRRGSKGKLREVNKAQIGVGADGDTVENK
jgi:hypothetical protein